MFGLVMRIYSVAFHVLLGLVMLAVGVVSLGSGEHTFRIGFLPWTGTALAYWLVALGAAAILFAVLAVRRILPVLFALWSLAVVVMLVRGFFLSPYQFDLTGFKTAIWFTVAALVAFVGSALQVRSGSYARRRQSTLA